MRGVIVCPEVHADYPAALHSEGGQPAYLRTLEALVVAGCDLVVFACARSEVAQIARAVRRVTSSDAIAFEAIPTCDRFSDGLKAAKKHQYRDGSADDYLAVVAGATQIPAAGQCLVTSDAGYVAGWVIYDQLARCRGEVPRAVLKHQKQAEEVPKWLRLPW